MGRITETHVAVAIVSMVTVNVGGGADAWLQALDESIIGREVGVGLHTAGNVWYLRLPCVAIVII